MTVIGKRKILIKTISVVKRGQVVSFDIPIPSNVKRIVGVTVTSSLTDNELETSYRYYGVGAAGLSEENFVLSLTKNHLNSVAAVFSLTTVAGEVRYYAHPQRLGKPTFTINGYEGAFNGGVDVNVTDPDTGLTEPYWLFQELAEHEGTYEISVF